ncbi:phosphatidate cytidylyltransferase [Sphingomonas ginkgonis]|uniref:Phosphatidate cytidylyltransferase n=1 Tax=Sphingomonas ginkgonis TaxID=2315330 RepID=A0A3R9WQM0_9SPHN|nr:phosphatidate cytidylyltransferase [Sphingomonas ginkgonis]RST31077.1 phosphatidate cytidylyltransferase [Sphingomonas ginkgonis]
MSEQQGASELTKRVVAGVAMVVVALAAAWAGGTVFAILCAAAATLMFYEWSRMVRGWGFAWQAAGFVYALIPALSLLWIRERAHDGFAQLMWVFLVTWSADIGAYFTGRALGGPKLAPSISPNKTVSGLVGGLVAATLVAGLWVAANHLQARWYLLAPLFAFASAMGDLFESGLKRKAGVKDSGTILPGHGGVLDRLDGLVPVAALAGLTVLLGAAA